MSFKNKQDELRNLIDVCTERVDEQVYSIGGSPTVLYNYPLYMVFVTCVVPNQGCKRVRFRVITSEFVWI